MCKRARDNPPDPKNGRRGAKRSGGRYAGNKKYERPQEEEGKRKKGSERLRPFSKNDPLPLVPLVVL